MNKKLAVLLVVPILIALGGTFAFSAFSGNSTVTINNTAGHLTWENEMTLIGTNANNTPITVEGPNGHIYEIGTGEAYHNANDSYKLVLGNQFYTTATSGKEFTVNVTNLAPGEYVELQAVITNNGTVGFMVSSTTTATTSSNATYNPNGQSISKMQVSQAAFMNDLEKSTGYIYNVTQSSGFNTSLSPEGTAVMDIWIGLGNSGGNDVNHYQGSDFSLTITLDIV
ncbi:hypothetical protein SE19_01465, partial [Acidiplasma aeolicum]